MTRIFTIHLRRHGLDPARDIVLLPEGFSWWAFIFAGLWALWLRMWWVALGLIVGVGVLNVLANRLFSDPVSAGVIGFGLALLAGILGNDLRRWTLERQGFEFSGLVAATDQDEALHKYLDGDMELSEEINRTEARYEAGS